MRILGAYDCLLWVGVVIRLEFIHTIVLPHHIHHLGKSVPVYAR